MVGSIHIGQRERNEMYDQTSRSLWLEDQLWPRLRLAFPIKGLPENALVTVGYPSSGARGRSSKIRPAEINTQWSGNPNEQVFISVHPNYFDKPINVAKALLFQAGKAVMGARWGAYHLGLIKLDDGTIEANADTQSKLEAILADIGDPPAGFGIAFPVREMQRARLRKYVPSSVECTMYMGNGKNFRHPIIRAACDTLNVTCKDCGTSYTLEQ